MVDTDFELEIHAGGVPDEFVVRVLRAPVGGEPRATLRVDVNDWLARRAQLEHAVRSSAARKPRPAGKVDQPLREAGSELFDSVFVGEIGSVYRASLAEAARRERSLRVVLRLTESELAVLPWEAMYDSSRRAYVCRKDEVVRHVPAPDSIAPLPVEPPLRILGLIASPRDLEELDSEAERDHLERALAGPMAEGLIELAWVEPASWSAVHERLLRGTWHVVHFIGHGDYDRDSDEGTLALVGDDGCCRWVEASRIRDLLGTTRPRPRLVVLNSCASAQGSDEELLSGTAATLVHSGIAAVAAMQFPITDQAAIEFPRGFYSALVAGKTVDEAVRSGRMEILGISRDTLEWVTPVLYVRGDTSRLFDIRTSLGTARPDEPRADGTRPGVEPRRTHPDPGWSRPVDEPKGTRRVPLVDDPAWDGALEAFHAGRWDDAHDRLRALSVRYPDEERVVAKLAEAGQQRALASWSADADVAFDQHRWDTAVDALQHIVAVDPHYQGATARLQQARRQQRRHELLEEITALHAAGRWHAVLDAAARLAELDPEATDADGLAADARRQLADADLAERYRNAIGLLEQRQWRPAVRHFENIARDRPGYRDTEGLLATARYHLNGSANRPSSPPTEPPPTRDRIRRPRPPPATGTLEVRASRIIDVGQWVRCVAFSPDGGRLATGSRQRLRVWELTTGELAWEKKTGDWYQDVWESTIYRKDGLPGGWSNDVRAVMFSPDGTRLATASGKTARLWDNSTGQELLTITHSHGVTGLAFSPEGTRLATTSADRSARIWDATTGAEQLTIKLTRWLSGVAFSSFGTFGVAFSPDGSRIATATGGKVARIRDAGNGYELLTVKHTDTVFGVAFSPDGSHLATASDDKTARVWDATNGDELLTLEHTGAVLGVAYSPDGSHLATASDDHSAQVWDALTGRGLTTVTHTDRVFAVAFSPDGNHLATASGDKTVRVSSFVDQNGS